MVTIADIVGVRLYDDAIQELLTVTIYPDASNPERPVVVIPEMGPGEREYSTTKKRDEFDQPVENMKTDKSLKFPVMGLSRLNWQFDHDRWSRVTRRKLALSADGNRVTQSDWPLPYNILYQLDILAKKRNTLNQIIRQIIVKFLHKERWVEVDLGVNFGKRKVPVKLHYGGPVDNTPLNLDVTEERVIRNTFSFELGAWIIPDAYTVPSVRKIITESYELRGALQTLDKLMEKTFE